MVILRWWVKLAVGQNFSWHSCKRFLTLATHFTPSRGLNWVPCIRQAFHVDNSTLGTYNLQHWNCILKRVKIGKDYINVQRHRPAWIIMMEVLWNMYCSWIRHYINPLLLKSIIISIFYL